MDHVKKVTKSEIFGHLKSIINNNGQDYHKSEKNLSLGDKIIHHTSPALKGMYTASLPEVHLPNAIKFVATEYRRFYNKLLSQFDIFYNNGYTNLEPSIWVEDAIKIINVAKNGDIFPFHNTRILPYNKNYLVFKPTIYSGLSSIPLPNNFIFDPDNFDSVDCILLYKNGKLLIDNYDYQIDNNTITLTSPLNGTDTLEIRYYENITGSYIPATPNIMGLLPVYKPEKLLDDTYATPINVIRKHDGTFIAAFNDERDDAILEYEIRVYNTIRRKFKQETDRFIDPLKIFPGKFRPNNHTFNDYIQTIAPYFVEWCSKNKINWSKNNTYDQNNWKTWNWSSLTDVLTNQPVQGNWRGIYLYWYDTVHPNTRPWEMLGFSEKPSWWETEYGTAPYTSNNNTMWTDIANGVIKNGPYAGVHEHLKRNNLLSFLPVDENGDLKSPYEIGIVSSVPAPDDAKKPWVPGDMSPFEYAFMNSPDGPFYEFLSLFLLKPFLVAEMGWDTDTIIKAPINNKQIINAKYKKRISNQLSRIHNQQIDGNYFCVSGISQWIVNKLDADSLNKNELLYNVFPYINSNLAWKCASFVNRENLKLVSEYLSPSSTTKTANIVLEENDFYVSVYESFGEDSVYYSGVLIEWTGKGYSVIGYNNSESNFKIIPSDINGPYTNIQINDTSVKKYKHAEENVIIEVPYGYEFKTKQEVFDFLISYERYLAANGLIFDFYDPTANAIFDWTYSGKEFLFWAQDVLNSGDFITLSPLAYNVKIFKKRGIIADLNSPNGKFSPVLDRNGFAIDVHDLDIIRNDNIFSVKTKSGNGIFGIQLITKEYESIVVLKNKTDFNDIIYEPLFGARQERIQAIGYRTKDWNGRLYSPGYIVDTTNNTLIPNIETSVKNIEKIHKIEDSPKDLKLNLPSKYNIGNTNKKYLQNLLLDRETEYQFYQGFIKQKGTYNSLNRILRSSAIISNSDVVFYEEWAIRAGMYGALDSQPPLEFYYNSSDISDNPQIITFTDGDVPDSISDNLISLLPNDERWVIKPDSTENIFKYRKKNTLNSDLPTAGYPKLGETDYLLAYSTDFFDKSNPVFNATDYDTIWVAQDNYNVIGRHNSWDVLMLTPVENLYVFSSTADLNILFTCKKEVKYGDGSSTTFNVNTIYSLTEFVYVKINGEVTTDYTLDTTNVIFNVPPKNNDIIEIYYLSNHEFIKNSLIFIDGIEKNYVPIGDTTNTSITINQKFLNLSTTYEHGTIKKLSSIRFNVNDDISKLNPSDMIGKYVYIDDNGNGSWAVYKSNGSKFRVEREEEAAVDSNLINYGLIYSERTNRILTKIPVFDPKKGILPGIVDSEISYKLEYDPAKYTNSPYQTYEDSIWTDDHVGKVWWDISTVRFIDYELGSIEYRYKNWGKIFPGSRIDIYEWVKSPVPPQEWEKYVENRNSQFDFETGGTVKDINSDFGPSWVEKKETDIYGNTKIYYYFWVKNKISVPNIDFREISIAEIEGIIKNPTTYGLSWLSPISGNAMIVANSNSQLIDDESVLQINFRISEYDSPIHYQWSLLREGDRLSLIPDRHWNKMRDSLVGFDDLGKEVPDVNLKGNSKYGHFFRPRQTWFKDKLLARKHFVNKTNDILKHINIIDNNLSLKSFFLKDEFIPNKTIAIGSVLNPTVNTNDSISINGINVVFSGVNGIETIANELNAALNAIEIYASIEYNGNDKLLKLTHNLGHNIEIVDINGTPSLSFGLLNLYVGDGPKFIVNSRDDRNNLLNVAINDKVLVQNDEFYNNYWSLWEFTTNGWVLLKIQNYDTTKYWKYADWYDTGFDSDILIDDYVQNLEELNVLTVKENTVIKVQNIGNNLWGIYQFINNEWISIAKENHTIELLPELYNNNLNLSGYDITPFDSMPFDNSPNIEFRKVLDGLRNDILITKNFIIYQNILFFAMLNHAHTEHTMIDWAFKTSYVLIEGFSKNLEQFPIFKNDGFYEFVDYFNEAKPYRTKIKDIIRTFATHIVDFNVNSIDYDRPPYSENNNVRILNDNDPGDALILQNDKNYKDWYNEYLTDNRPSVPRANNVRKIKTTLLFDRVATINEQFIPTKVFNEYPDPFDTVPFFRKTLDKKNTIDIYKFEFFNNVTAQTIGNVFTKTRKPFKDYRIIFEGMYDSTTSIELEASNDKTFTTGVYSIGIYFHNDTLKFSKIKDYRFIRAKTNNINSGNNFSAFIECSYSNALHRALTSYLPTTGLPRLIDIIEEKYNGTIIDGGRLLSGAGWDGAGWDEFGWDISKSDINNYLDKLILGGTMATFIGDNITNKFDIPSGDNGIAPYSVYVSDLSLSPKQPIRLDENVHYFIDYSNNTLNLISNPIFTWLTNSGALKSGWCIVIFDSTFMSASSLDVVNHGDAIIQPYTKSNNDEIANLKINENVLVTVLTTGKSEYKLFDNNQGLQKSSIISYNYGDIIKFTYSGLTGINTIKIYGSDSGYFSGEETLIISTSTDGFSIVPDLLNGYNSFKFYQAEISNYVSGAIFVKAEIAYSPNISKNQIVYDNNINNGPYPISNIQSSDDAIVSKNGYILEPNVDYSINASTNSITFITPISLNDSVYITTFDTANSETNVTWTKTQWNNIAIDLTNINSLNLLPTNEPKENNIMIFAETTSGYELLSPPRSLSHKTVINKSIYNANNGYKINAGTNNIKVYLDSYLLTDGTEYQYNSGYYYNPEVTVNSGGTGYSINDILTVSGGIGTPIQLKVIETNSGIVTSVAIVNSGNYTTTPTNPVSVTGGTGTGATFNLGNYSVQPDYITVLQSTKSKEFINDITSIVNNGSNYEVNDILTVIGGNGQSATIIVDSVSNTGAIISAKILDTGLYDTAPTNPVSVTGGTGSGASFNIAIQSTFDDNKKLTIQTFGEEDYNITGNNLSLLSIPNGTNIGIYSFVPYTNTLSMESTTVIGEKNIYIGSNIKNDNAIVVAINNNGLSLGGRLLNPSEYTITHNGGFDTTGFDTDGYDNNFGTVIHLNIPVNASDLITVYTYNGYELSPSVVYRHHYGYDAKNEFIESLRLSTKFSSSLKNDFQPFDKSLTIKDGYFFPNKGVIWINGERIEYLNKTGGVNPGDEATLTGLIRGSKGTRKNHKHVFGSVVYVGDTSQQIKNGTNQIFNDPGKTLQNSSNSIALFLNEEPGTYKSF